MAKIRNGFISNSSSTSFVIDASKYNETEVRNIIEKMISVVELSYKQKYSIDDICCITSSKTGKEFCERIKKYYSSFGEGVSQQLLKYETKKVVIVDSMYDNSIPWEIQDVLENLGYRQHWG